MKKAIINITGMHCGSCADLIKMELEGKVKSADINLEKKQAIIKFDENNISEEDIKETIYKLGYETH